MFSRKRREEKRKTAVNKGFRFVREYGREEENK